MEKSFRQMLADKGGRRMADEPMVYRDLQEVRVKVADVLAKLRENRDQHRAVFEEALDGWHKAVIEALEGALRDARAGKKYNPYIALPQPQDHTRDYDVAIAMLEMTQDKQLLLSSREFAMYVLDDWGWTGDFLGTSSAYSVTAAKLSSGRSR